MASIEDALFVEDARLKKEIGRTYVSDENTQSRVWPERWQLKQAESSNISIPFSTLSNEIGYVEIILLFIPHFAKIYDGVGVKLVYACQDLLDSSVRTTVVAYSTVSTWHGINCLGRSCCSCKMILLRIADVVIVSGRYGKL